MAPPNDLSECLASVAELEPCAPVDAPTSPERRRPRFRPTETVRLRLRLGRELWSARLLEVGRRGLSLVIDDDLAARLPGGTPALLGYDRRIGEVAWLSGCVHRRLKQSHDDGAVVAFTLRAVNEQGAAS